MHKILLTATTALRKGYLSVPFCFVFLCLIAVTPVQGQDDCCSLATEELGIQERFEKLVFNLSSDGCHCPAGQSAPCAETTNYQDGESICSVGAGSVDGTGSLPAVGNQVWIRAFCTQASSDIYYDGLATVGLKYTIDANLYCTGNCILCPEVTIQIFNTTIIGGVGPSTLLQSVTIHASCSEEVGPGDLFGASEVVFGIMPQGSGTFECDETDFLNLPLNLLSFGYLDEGENRIRFQWEVDEVINFSHFELEKGSDPAKGYELLEEVTLEQFPDLSFFSEAYTWPEENTFYRLKIVDLDGSYTYSRVLPVNGRPGQISVVPNPADEDIVYVSLPDDHPTEVRIFLSSGQLLQSEMISGEGRQELALPSYIKNQVLILQFVRKEESQIRRILKL